MPAHFLQGAARQPGTVAGYYQHGYAAAPLVARVGAHGHRQVVSAHSRGNKDFFAVHHIVVAVQARGGAQGRHVGAAAGLGNGKRGNFFATQHRRYHLALQRVRAPAQHRRQADVVAKQAGHQAAAAALARQGFGQHIAQGGGRRGATQVFRVAQSEPAQISGAAVQAARKLLRRLPIGQVGRHLLAHKALGTVVQVGDVFSTGGGLHGGVQRCGRLATPMVLAMMPSMTSSAPPPIEARRPSRNIRETLFSQV